MLKTKNQPWKSSFMFKVREIGINKPNYKLYYDTNP